MKPGVRITNTTLYMLNCRSVHVVVRKTTGGSRVFSIVGLGENSTLPTLLFVDILHL